MLNYKKVFIEIIFNVRVLHRSGRSPEEGDFLDPKWKTTTKKRRLQLVVRNASVLKFSCDFPEDL